MSADSLFLFEEFHKAKQAYLASGRRLIDLSMINPDLPCPRILVDKLMEAINKPQYHRYSVSRGIKRLREAFAQKYQTSFDVTLSPQTQVCVSMGTKDALSSSLRVLRHELPSAKITAFVPTPVYPAHLWALQEAGFSVVPVAFDSAPQLLANLSQAIQAHKDSAAVLVTNFPHNPTGITLSSESWAQILNLCAAEDLYVINDFVYGELVFDSTNGKAVSVLAQAQVQNKILETYSLSKAYSIPGWRVGAVVGDPSLISKIAAYKGQIDYGVFTPLQVAAVSALEAGPELLAPLREQYARRLQLLVKGLSQRGFKVFQPQGGLSVWAQLPTEYLESFQEVGSAQRFSQAVLQKHGVALLSGDFFSCQSKLYSGYVRLAVVASDLELQKALNACELETRVG